MYIHVYIYIERERERNIFPLDSFHPIVVGRGGRYADMGEAVSYGAGLGVDRGRHAAAASAHAKSPHN